MDKKQDLLNVITSVFPPNTKLNPGFHVASCSKNICLETDGMESDQAIKTTVQTTFSATQKLEYAELSVGSVSKNQAAKQRCLVEFALMKVLCALILFLCVTFVRFPSGQSCGVRQAQESTAHQ